MSDKMADHEPWPMRAAGLALLGALLATLFNQLMQEGGGRWTEDAVRISGATFVAVGGLAFAFTLERTRPFWSLAFGVVAGLVIGLIFYSQGSPLGWSAGDEWRVFSGLLVVAVVAPLFQAARDAGRPRFTAEPIHAHAWTNIVLWFAAWIFTGIAFLLVQLLAELFMLIGISLLRDALRESWFNAAIIGAALGGAIGLLRDRDAVLATFQRVVTTILSVLAPVLAAGLVLFVAALPFTGLAPLWDTTRSTTPVLLAVIAGAFILANAVVGNSAEDEARSGVLRLSAVALGVVMAPLASVAAISTWLRVDQYGYTPERLWALVFVSLVLVIAATYLWTAVRGRIGWGARLRPANVRLAIMLCGVGLLLATPLIDFGAISTRDQIARLESGRTAPEQFDWAALRFDFGPAGVQALERLRASGAAPLQEAAARALATKDRHLLAEQARVQGNASRLGRTLRVLPAAAPLPPELRTAVANMYNICAVGPCTLIWQPGQTEALVLGFPCESCQAGLSQLALDSTGRWTERSVGADTIGASPADHRAQQRAAAAGQVEIRPVQRRQLFLGGEPFGPAF